MNGGALNGKGAAITVATVLSAVGLTMAVVTLVLCVFLCIKRREIAGMTIVRVIFLLQILETLRCMVDIIAIYTNPAHNAGCRVLVFFTLVLAAAPLNLSVICMVYFQTVLLHKVAVRGRYLRLALLAVVTIYTVVPPLFTLIIPAHTAGMSSYCAFFEAPSRRLFVFKWLVFYIWIMLVSVVGLGSITVMAVAIFQRSCEAQSRMSTASTAGLRASGQPCGVSSDRNAPAAKEGPERRRRSSGLVVARTLRSMVWFSVVPIVSFAFNTAYSIVWYHTQELPLAAVIVDQVLQFLAVPLFCLSFYLNPCVQRAFAQYLLDRKGIVAADSPPDSLARLSYCHESTLQDATSTHTEHKPPADSSTSPNTPIYSPTSTKQ
ncbi:hypothetical protein H4R19_004002 [Coemansia spiralis]|nr:hypothetical protein H4R19_004002 [Coemansia spiralis]